MFTAYPAAQAVLLLMYMLDIPGLGTETAAIISAGVAALCVVLDAALLAAYKNRRQKKSLAMKNELLEKQRRMQQERLQELDRQDGEIQAMCAAITAEAEELRRMLERGETEQARACAERVLADNAYRARLENCENPIADSFLATRADSLRAAGIRLELETRLPYHLGITDVELITMLGNLLDNAAEACEKLEPEKRRVSLRAAQGDGFFAVHMENSCLPQAQPAPRRIRGLQRGLGLTILEELARRYDGAVSAGPGGEGVYLTDITLQTGSKGALAT